MSLILEALKKLDREKKVPDRGFLVVGAVPWPAPRPRRWLPALIAAAAGTAAVMALVLAWRARRHEDVPGRAAVPSTMAVGVPAVEAAPATTPAVGPPTIPARAVESRARVPGTRPPVEPPAAAHSDVPSGGPAAAPAAPSEPGADLQLQAISERDGKPIAVLNSRVVHEGDRFDGVRVLRIGVDEVEIEVQGRRRILRF